MQDFLRNLMIGLPGFLFAIVAHEWAHGRMAKFFGDDTAERQGRLTLNPVAHIHPFGTILWPLVCVAFGGVIFGYARPVPVNPTRFNNVRKGIFWVSFAGPLMNIILGVLSSFLLIMVGVYLGDGLSVKITLLEILNASLFINFILAFFNLIPIPPLDGSKMVSSFLSYDAQLKYDRLGQYSFFILIGLIVAESSGVPILSTLLLPAKISATFFPNLFAYLLS